MYVYTDHGEVTAWTGRIHYYLRLLQRLLYICVGVYRAGAGRELRFKVDKREQSDCIMYIRIPLVELADRRLSSLSTSCDSRIYTLALFETVRRHFPPLDDEWFSLSALGLRVERSRTRACRMFSDMCIHISTDACMWPEPESSLDHGSIFWVDTSLESEWDFMYRHRVYFSIRWILC